MPVRVGDLEGRLRLDTAQWDRGMARMRSSVGRAEQRMQQVSAAVGVWGRRVGLAFAAASVTSVKMAADFETSMTKIITLVGVAEKQVDEWRSSVLRMAAETGKAPRELSDALFVVTSAGIRGAKSLQVLKQSAKASAVGLGETKDIARAVTAAMQAYGAENLSAQRAVEIMMSTVREGNLEADALASTLGRVIPIASQMGISFENVGAFISTFTRLGVNAEEATTSLRAALNLMLNPGKAAAEALARLGLSMDELRKVAREEGLPKAFAMLNNALKGNEDALGKVIPNVRALTGFLGVAGAQAEVFSTNLVSISNSAGIVDEGFERVQKTTAFAFNQMMANVKVLAIRIGTVLLPVATKILKWATDLVKRTERWTQVLDEQLPVIVAWGEFGVQAVKTVALAFAGLVRVAFNVGQMIGDAFDIAFNLMVGSMLKATETVIASWRVLAAVGGTIFAPLGGAMELLADKFPDLEGRSEGFFNQAEEQAKNFEKNLEDIGDAIFQAADAFDDLRLKAGRALQTTARVAGGVGAAVPGAPPQRFPSLRPQVRAQQLAVSPLTVRNANRELTGFGATLKKAKIHLTEFGRSLVDMAREQLDPRMILSDLAAQGIGALAGAALEGIRGLFDDPEADRMREALRANADAADNLRRSLDAQAAIVAGAPGGLLAGVRTAIQEAISGVGRAGGIFDLLGAELDKLGLTMDDVRRVAKILGLEFVESNAGMIQIVNALNQLSVSDLFESIAGQLDLMQRRFEIFDIEDPVARMAATLDKFLEAADLGAIEETLRGLDLSKAADRLQLDEIIRSLFEQIESGALKLADLGKLSATEFLDLLIQMEGLGDAVDKTTDGFKAMTQELSAVPRGFKIAYERFQATTGQRFPSTTSGERGSTGLPGTTGIGENIVEAPDAQSVVPQIFDQSGGGFQTVTAGDVLGTQGARGVGDQIINVDEVHIHPAPAQSGEQLWEEMAQAARRQARRGGASNLDLALAQR